MSRARPLWVMVLTPTLLLLLGAGAPALAGAPERPAARPAAPRAIVGARISYQGRLTDPAGNPLGGAHDLVFQLWDDAAAGSQVGADIALPGVPVTGGLFTVELPVDATSFPGSARWLRIGVDGQWLSPRQALLAVPYALGLRPAATETAA